MHRSSVRRRRVRSDQRGSERAVCPRRLGHPAKVQKYARQIRCGVSVSFDAHFGFVLCFFFFNDTATTEIYTLSLHDALPIFRNAFQFRMILELEAVGEFAIHASDAERASIEKSHRDILQEAEDGIADELVERAQRSEEHTSELQSH